MSCLLVLLSLAAPTNAYLDSDAASIASMCDGSVAAKPVSFALSAPTDSMASVADVDAAAADARESLPNQTPSATQPVPARHGLDYSYLEANYVWTDSDDADEKLGGIELVGSVEFLKQFFAQVSYSHQSDHADLDRFLIGAGYHLPLADNLDVYGLLSFGNEEVDHTGDDFSDTGIAAEIGTRIEVTPTFEVNGALEWSDFHDSKGGARVGARYYFTRALSIGARTEFVDDDTTLAAGLRLQF